MSTRIRSQACYLVPRRHEDHKATYEHAEPLTIVPCTCTALQGDANAEGHIPYLWTSSRYGHRRVEIYISDYLLE